MASCKALASIRSERAVSTSFLTAASTSLADSGSLQFDFAASASFKAVRASSVAELACTCVALKASSDFSAMPDSASACASLRLAAANAISASRLLTLAILSASEIFLNFSAHSVFDRAAFSTLASASSILAPNSFNLFICERRKAAAFGVSSEAVRNPSQRQRSPDFVTIRCPGRSTGCKRSTSEDSAMPICINLRASNRGA